MSRRTELFFLTVAIPLATAALPAAAEMTQEERNFRDNAVGHANALTSAYRRLDNYVRYRATEEIDWFGTIPPAQTGWMADWTERGVRARYCGDTLLVYMERERLKGVGRNQRAVRVAPRVYKQGRGSALQWLDGLSVTGSSGTAMSLPDCMEDDYVEALPNGRVALAGTLRDPNTNLREQTTHERREESCPAGTHAITDFGRSLTRTVRQSYNLRNEAVGEPVYGDWEVQVDGCVADYTRTEQYVSRCTWTNPTRPGVTERGSQVWRRTKTVTAAGEVYGPATLHFTTCQTDTPPTAPQPTVTTSTNVQTTTGSCGSGYTGTRRYKRTVTTESILFPWDDTPQDKSEVSGWRQTSNSCQRVQSSSSGGGGDRGGDNQRDHDGDGKSEQEGDPDDRDAGDGGSAHS